MAPSPNGLRAATRRKIQPAARMLTCDSSTSVAPAPEGEGIQVNARLPGARSPSVRIRSTPSARGLTHALPRRLKSGISSSQSISCSTPPAPDGDGRRSMTSALTSDGIASR